MKVLHNIHTMEDLIQLVKKYQVQIVSFLGLMVFIIGGSYGYIYYKKGREESAYKALAMAIEYFDAPVKKADDKVDDDLSFLDTKEFSSYEEKWNKVDSVFKEKYESHKGSGISPLFLVYRSRALVELGKLADAIDVMRAAVNKTRNKDVKGYYTVKLALMLIDYGKTGENATASLSEGIESLEKVAGQDNNVAQDVALYHLGNFYWYERKFAEARNYWNQLVLKFGSDSAAKHSPWLDAAKSKLRLIDSDVD